MAGPAAAPLDLLPATRAELEKLDYDGWAVVEQDVDLSNATGPPPVESARVSRRHLADIAAATQAP